MYVKHEDIHQKSENISVLGSELSQRGINILHRADVYQVFHKHTRLMSEPPGGRPLPQQTEAAGGLRRAGVPGGQHGQPTVRSPVGGEDPLEAATEKGTGFPRNHVTRGRRQNFPLLFHPHRPSTDQKKLGKMSSSGRNRVSGFEQRGQRGAPFGAEGRKAQDRPGSWT